MDWGPIIYILLTSVFFSICIPAGIAAYWCWVNRRSEDTVAPVLVRFALLLAAVSYDSFSRLIATGFGFEGQKPQFSIGYAVAYWQGQVVLSIAITVLLSYLISGGRPSDNVTPAKGTKGSR